MNGYPSQIQFIVVSAVRDAIAIHVNRKHPRSRNIQHQRTEKSRPNNYICLNAQQY